MDYRAAVAAFLFAAAFTVLYGCVQNSVPKACEGLDNLSLRIFATCVYNEAVLGQNPFYCYSLAGLEERKACIRDASSPAARNALQKQLAIPVPEEKPAEPPPETQVKNETPAQLPYLPQCGEEGTEARDSCLKSFGVENASYAACENISDSAAGKSCVTEIAIMTKNLSACHDLAIRENFDLCNLYAKAG